jgi:Cytochrome P460
MTRVTSWLVVIPAAALAVLGGRAISAQDRYTVQVPGGLAFSEFRGYEDWPAIAISENGGVVAVIVGNPTMIDALKAGVPGNGQPFPDGAKMAKIHWSPKKQETYPGPPTVPGAQLTPISWSRTARGSRTAADGDGPHSTTTPRPIPLAPPLTRPSRRRDTTRSAGWRATRS